MIFIDFYDDSNAVHTLDTNSVLTNTFFRMFLGLLASALTAFFAYSSGMYETMIYNGYYAILAIIEVVVVLVFSFLFKKLSPTAVTVLFFAYAFLNGFTLSVVFAAYELTSIAYAFIATSALFGALAYLGYKTDKDISNLGTILTVALLIGIVLTIINIFLRSSALDIFLDWAILFIFFGLTVYDINKIKQMQSMGFCDDEKLYVYGAMQLYLDFINIFLRILSLFGKRRN
ncbi:MAG: Bax inhibitor-1/YccA family protein [Clostridia bacterium]|nr:Bax inhibitor-1/YccA family protein [Clostridia bacterium]